MFLLLKSANNVGDRSYRILIFMYLLRVVIDLKRLAFNLEEGIAEDVIPGSTE